MGSPATRLPTTAVHILVALAAGPLHGYGIMSDVAALTGGAVRLAPGTLYTNIKRLLTAGLIEEADPPLDATSDDPRRRYYRLTPLGQAAVAAEIDRMDRLVQRARAAGPTSSRPA
jgi:DNA-binding PadR family transcriptional regulator